MPIYLESTLKDNQKDIKERAEFEDQKDAIFKLRNKSFVRVELTKDILQAKSLAVMRTYRS